MRYEDWDILIFPRDLAIPMKEFKVTCHVVHDVEFAHTHGSFGLPTMTCFIPSLPAGTPFNISIHSWRFPDISQFTQAYSKHPELVKFEARVLIDGIFVASTSFERTGTWPHLLSHSFEFTKNGDLEPLKFPMFRKELLHESLWSPADDTGRIRIVISEGFPRDSLSMPIERVKNVVAFSFQHAPLQILENSGIAWPNPVMWRRTPLTTAMQVPSYPAEEGAESHAHSPRRRQNARAGPAATLTTPFAPGLMPNPASVRLVSRTGTGMAGTAGASTTAPPPDPFAEPEAYYEWMANIGLQDMSRNAFGPVVRTTSKVSSSDTSMPDYASSHHSGRVSMGVPDPTMPYIAYQRQSLRHLNTSLEDFAHGGSLKVPTNTPVAGPGETPDFAGVHPDLSSSATTAWSSADVAAALASTLSSSDMSGLTNSLLCQPLHHPVHPHNIPLPASEVKSRKENRGLDSNNNDSPSTLAAASQMAQQQRPSSSFTPERVPDAARKVSQPLFNLAAAGMSLGTVPADTPSSTQCQVSLSGSGAEMLRSGSLSLESAKRGRTFTPASVRVIDDEDEPRRESPLVQADGVQA